MLSIRALSYFLAVVQEGNILAAAKKLHMAQPPLSRSLKQLEETLGCTLFNRGARQIELTDAGKKFQIRAEQMLKLMDTTISEIKTIEDGSYATLSLGTGSSCGVTILPKVANIFHTQYPHMKFELWDGESINIAELVENGIVEVGLVRFAFDRESFNVIQLPKDPLVCAIHKKADGLLPKTKYISLKDLENQPLLIHRKYEPLVTEHCHQIGFDPDYLCQADDIMPILAWADAGVGIAVVPHSAIGMIPTPHVIFRTLTDPIMELNLALIWRKNHILSAAAEKFIDVFMTLHTL